MKVYKNKKTEVLYRTNYFDHFGGVMMSDEGLVQFAQVEEVDLPRKEAMQLPEYK